MRVMLIGMMWGWYSSFLTFMVLAIQGRSIMLLPNGLSFCFFAAMIGTIGGLFLEAADRFFGPNWQRWSEWKRRHNFGRD
jgi:hypothetical protein